MKQRVYEIVEIAKEGDRTSRIFDIFIITLILINVAEIILASVHPLFLLWRPWFIIIEIVSIIVFSIEYALRIWSCTANPEYKDPVRGRLHFALTPYVVIDFLAIAPFYLLVFTPFNFGFLRILRVFRLFKIARYANSFNMIINVLRREKEALMTTIFVLLTILVVASCLMFQVEYTAQPEAFSSIPAAMWWGVATLTTVGYGDIYPVTGLGKILGSVIALIGIGLFALPAGILASGFAEELSAEKREAEERGHVICPFCGAEFSPEETE